MKIVVQQEQDSYLKERYGAKTKLLRAPLLEIFINDYKKASGKRRGIRYIVPDSVSNYIKEHDIYQQTNSYNGYICIPPQSNTDKQYA